MCKGSEFNTRKAFINIVGHRKKIISINPVF
jgi:hypothetical protein